MLWSRRTIFMALVVGLPVAVAAVMRVLFEFDARIFESGRTSVQGPELFGLMIWGFFVRFSVPVLAVFYGTALVADEIEDKTITYLFTRPISRGALLVGKYLAYLTCTVFVVLPAVTLVWLLVIPINGSLAQGFPALATDLGLLAVGLASYGALFGWVGAAVKRPLVIGLAFIFGWEVLAVALPGSLKMLTVAHYLQGLVPHAMPVNSTMGVVQALLREPPSLAESLLGLSVITLGGLGLGVRTIGRREYVLEQ
jgi:ABC-type transport system involved in multi-copper enzyme maturation permease subunit